VAEAEAGEEQAASDAIAEIVETVATDEASEEAVASEAIHEIARETMEANTEG
jgi:hypothetical protein